MAGGNVSVNFDVHKPSHLDVVPTLPRVQMEALVEESHCALPALTRMSMVQHYNVVGSSTGIIGTLLAVVLCIYVIHRFCTPCGKCQNFLSKKKMTTPTEAQPTPDALSTVRVTQPLYPVELLAQCSTASTATEEIPLSTVHKFSK